VSYRFRQPLLEPAFSGPVSVEPGYFLTVEVAGQPDRLSAVVFHVVPAVDDLEAAGKDLAHWHAGADTEVVIGNGPGAQEERLSYVLITSAPARVTN
jgi:hypothetical protein